MKIPVYHLTFNSSGIQTINFNRDLHSMLVKNLTDDKILFSWGNQIDPLEYVIIPPDMGELIEYCEITHGNINATVQALGTGTVEFRVIDD